MSSSGAVESVILLLTGGVVEMPAEGIGCSARPGFAQLVDAVETLSSFIVGVAFEAMAMAEVRLLCRCAVLSNVLD